MPTYDYVCTNPDCTEYENPWEIHQGIHDEKLLVCRHCEQETLTRLFGRGMYVTVVGPHKGHPRAHKSTRTIRT
jgi:predicted nucleic acid-binding Zn ribbon protein